MRTRGLEAANRQLRHLATHDALTGLPNRVLLDDRLTQAMAHADRDGRPFALMVCDLDRFKLVNDSLGHSAGDELLQEVARRFTELVRATDTVARLGGDEFVLLITSIDHTGRCEAAREPRRRGAAGAGAHRAGSTCIPRRASASRSILTDGKTIEALTAHADAAMYCAKQRGRGCVQCFEGDMSAGVEDRVQLESDLHQAIALKQFELYYQPKVHTNTGAVRSAEALIRWIHPERGADPAGRLHSARRGMRPDRRDRRVGGARGLPAGARLAAIAGLAPHARLGESVALAVSRQRLDPIPSAARSTEASSIRSISRSSSPRAP